MRVLAGVAAAAVVLTLGGCAAKGLTQDQSCHVGVYRLADGSLVDLAPADGPDLRWRRFDGRTGRLRAEKAWLSTGGWGETPDGVKVALPDCDSLAFAEPGAAAQAGRRVALSVRETTFESDGLTLAGRLVMPAGDAAVPVMVEVHGSEADSALDYNYRQRLFPAQGVGVFVYDKRGTGRSEGKYTQDFEALSRDAAAAARAARALAGARAASLGFDGGSQAGWIIPLAAMKVPVDFAIVGYGLVDSPLAENRDEALQDLAAAGWGPEIRPKALEVIGATEKVMASRFRSGYPELAAVKAKYGEEPWFKDVRGEFSGDLLSRPGWMIRVVGPFYDKGTTWTYDPRPALRATRAPLLWVLAGADTSAPVEETRRRLLTIAGEGAPITVLEFPNTEHGVLEFTTAADGTRTETRYAEGYFQAGLDFARTRQLDGTYGKAARLTPAPSSSPSPGREREGPASRSDVGG